MTRDPGRAVVARLEVRRSLAQGTGLEQKTKCQEKVLFLVTINKGREKDDDKHGLSLAL